MNPSESEILVAQLRQRDLNAADRNDRGCVLLKQAKVFCGKLFGGARIPRTVACKGKANNNR